MVEILDENSNYEEYEKFISNNKYGHFMQSIKWAKLKKDWRYNVIIVKNNNIIIGTMLILIRKIISILPYTIMYSPRGPIYDFSKFNNNEKLLSIIIKAARKLAYLNKSYVLKLDPNLSIIEPKVELEKFGFLLNNKNKNFESIQPRYVFRLDVFKKTLEDIFNNFSSKTRYNIRYALKKKVHIKICDASMLPAFYKIMIETSVRDKFVPRNLEYFKDMLKLFENNIRLYMAFTDDNIPIAGSIAINYAKKTWYLYGASSNSHRNLMPNYLLQYEMIKWALDTKCYFYDFRGVSGDIYNKNNPLYGLYKFKKGFSGELVELIGEYDLVTNKCFNFLFNNLKKHYITFRRKMYLKNINL